MLRSKEQSAKEAKLLNGLSVTLNGQVFNHIKQNKYGAIYTGKNGATYTAMVNPRGIVIEDKTLPAFYMMARGGREVGAFTIVDGLIVECESV